MNDELKVVARRRGSTGIMAAIRRQPELPASAMASPTTPASDDIDPVVLPRLGFTYDLPDFSFFRRSQAAGRRRHLLGRRSDCVVRQRVPEQRHRLRAGQVTCGRRLPGRADRRRRQAAPSPAFRHASRIAAAARGAGNGFTQSVDPNIKMPTVWRANIGYQADLDSARARSAAAGTQPRLYLQPLPEPVHDRRSVTAVRHPERRLNGFSRSTAGRSMRRSIRCVRVAQRSWTASPRPRSTRA